VTLWRLTASHFCAGFTEANGRVQQTAPILKWMRGKSLEELGAYFKRRNWTLERVQ
jgi:hypothetical protein